MGHRLRLPDESAPHLRAMTARPFLNRYFPDHDIIIWLDADIWVQAPEALLIYVQGAMERGFAATPEVDRSYQTHHGPNKFTDFHDAVFRECFGPELGAKLRRFSLINSGAFAAKSSSPVWSHWAEIYERIANRTEVPHAEQAALNAAVWAEWEAGGVALLPAACNWICSLAQPAVGSGRSRPPACGSRTFRTRRSASLPIMAGLDGTGHAKNAARR